MKRSRQHRWIGRLALGLALAAIAAPSAQGYYFGEAGTAANVPSGAPAGPTVVPAEPAEEVSRPGPVADDMIAGLPSLEQLRQFSFEGQNRAPAGAAPPASPAPAPGFDWADAGVGVGIGAGLALILAAALVLVRRRGLAGA